LARSWRGSGTWSGSWWRTGCAAAPRARINPCALPGVMVDEVGAAIRGLALFPPMWELVSSQVSGSRRGSWRRSLCRNLRHRGTDGTLELCGSLWQCQQRCTRGAFHAYLCILGCGQMRRWFRSIKFDSPIHLNTRHTRQRAKDRTAAAPQLHT